MLKVSSLFGKNTNTDALRTSKPNIDKVVLTDDLMQLKGIRDRVLTITPTERVLLNKKIEILEKAVKPQYLPFQRKVDPLLTQQEETEIDRMKNIYRTRPLFENYKPPEFNPKPELQFQKKQPTLTKKTIFQSYNNMNKERREMFDRDVLSLGKPNLPDVEFELIKTEKVPIPSHNNLLKYYTTQKRNEMNFDGGRQKPKKKPTNATMNMKDIKRLCKANQIKLSKTKDGIRIIYTKKELITKLKRKKIL